ncbi:unnamed protein product [Trichobilharzia regenti]|nr:unnamed protein product [Trichobilharzia regenti]
MSRLSLLYSQFHSEIRGCVYLSRSLNHLSRLISLVLIKYIRYLFLDETRSTVSDTWSTDVLPSDTEYADLGQEFSGSQANLTPEIMSRRLSNRTSPRVSHRHTHRHHHHRRTAPVSESLTPETTEANLRPLPDVSSESNGGEMQQHLPSESPLEGVTVSEEGESGTDNVEVNNSVHLEGDAVNSKRNHQCQDNFESSQPTDSNSTEKKISFSQPSANSVDFSAATDYPIPSTSYAKIPPVQTDKDKFRTLQPTDGRRSVNANRFHGSAHNLKESFSRLMERLDIMTKRQRISTNPGFEKQNGISGACHYTDCQSNLGFSSRIRFLYNMLQTGNFQSFFIPVTTNGTHNTMDT